MRPGYRRLKPNKKRFMEEEKNKLETFAAHIEDLITTYYQLTTVKAARKTTTVTAEGFYVVVLVILCMFVLFFAGLGLAWWVGSITHNIQLGYFIVGGFFLLLLLLLVVLRKKILAPLKNIIVRKLYE